MSNSFAMRIMASTKALTKKQQELVQAIEKNLGLELMGRAHQSKREIVGLDVDGLQQHQIHAIENYGTKHKKFRVEPNGVRTLALIMPESKFY